MAADGYLDWAGPSDDESDTDTEKVRLILARERANAALSEARIRTTNRKRRKKKTYADYLNTLLRAAPYTDYYVYQPDVGGQLNAATRVWKRGPYGSIKYDGFTFGRLHRNLLIDTGMDVPDNMRYFNRMCAIIAEEGRQFVPDYSRRIMIQDPSNADYTIRLRDYVHRDELQLHTHRIPTLIVKPLLPERSFTESIPRRFFKVMADQRWSVETAWLYCALVGRWCYGRGHPDNWHVLPFDLGVPGAGKGVMMEIKRAFWPGDLCADIQYGDRTDFNLGACQHAEVCYINEADSTENQRLSIAQLNKMAAGECVDSNTKWGRKESMPFYLPLWFNGNTMVRFRAGRSEDQGLMRRLAPFPFLHSVVGTDRANANITDEIRRFELSSIFITCISVYNALRDDVGNALFPLSEQMMRFRKSQLTHVNPVVWFFRCCVRFTSTADNENWLTLDELQTKFSAFLEHFELHTRYTRIEADMLKTSVLPHLNGAHALGVRNDTDVLLFATWRPHGSAWLDALGSVSRANFTREVLLTPEERQSVKPLRVLDWFRAAWEENLPTV